VIVVESVEPSTLQLAPRPPISVGMVAVCPIYYQVPLYRRLAADSRLRFTAIFASDAGVRPRDFGYGEPVAWTEDLLSGYESLFLRRAGRNHAYGKSWSIRDPDVVGLVLRTGFDVVWLNGYSYVTQMLALAAQRLRGGAVMFREEQTLIHGRGRLNAAAKELVLRALFRDGPAMYLGAESRRWFEHYGVPRGRTAFVPYAIENLEHASAVDAARKRRVELRAELGLATDRPVVLTVSRLTHNKQQLAVLEAFRRVRARVPCSLLVVGSGELEAELRNAVARHATPDVVFAGFVNRDRIPEVYAVSDAFVLFSRLHETWGLVINEAMASSLPVVASDACGSAADLLRDGYSGFVVDRDDIGALEDRLVRLMTDAGLRQRLGYEGRKLVDGFTYDIAAEGVVRAAEMAAGAQSYGPA
jgi:glycosyltransferase involved in cell wall biosynthesis